MDASVARAQGLIGPNAISQVALALPLLRGRAVAEQVFAQAGLLQHWREPPTQMLPEQQVAALHRTLRQLLPEEQAVEVARAAGRATADYLLARRIPAAAQRVLRALPPPLAAWALRRAIAAHAWTFAGSGRFGSRRHELRIECNPLCRGLHSAQPTCDYHAAAFERLFAALVHPAAQLRQVACEARGDDACRFELRW
jgi:divinyl protochlorophyllide a 8-vinyl-reductase